MEAEATPFVEHLKLVKLEGFFPDTVPFHAFSGSYNGSTTHKITVVTNGKDHVYATGADNCGTVPAAMVAFLALTKTTDADLLINAGTCGGFSAKGAAIGDVFLTTAVAHHDRRIPIPAFDAYGVGKLETKMQSMTLQLADVLQCKLGICTTGNSLDKTDEDVKQMLANDASVKDMEAAAIAWSCALHNVPFMGLKVVTDIVDGNQPTQDEFLENLHAASQSLQQALPKVLDYVLGKEHGAL